MITLETLLNHPLFEDVEPEELRKEWALYKQDSMPFRAFYNEAFTMGFAQPKRIEAKVIAGLARVHYHVRINNSNVAFYSRLLSVMDPTFEKLFKFRKHHGFILKRAA